ncbi:NAD-dependent epimerase/dehydratase family protein [Roseicitreum antarcticum]|uniref:Nucleoside-diphosphate-sugar epimerase n=1 Tax=Roseicitreum antarcticum TaxID=564137 RepID=A0A1H3CRF5_9RHOB|nr:NAD-dependent epimerase/dehydratase family protein [Roseicitreum antarcticum]SDX56705.1 Nucleoside-diphosphate-sugar epimerase [Roseicitreum antarcticum]
MSGEWRPEPALQGTIVVFGGAGFVGTHLLERLRKDLDTPLISVDIRAPKHPVDGVTYMTHDVRDLSQLDIGAPVPLLFNLAAVHTTPGHEPWEYYDANVRGAIEISRFARRHQTRKICFTSSISVYGPCETPLDETSTPAPKSDYGRSKLMAEQVFKDWVHEDPAHALVTARPAVVFGRGEGGNFTRLARMLNRGFFIYPGRKDTIKSCIHVGDLVEWMLFAVQRSDKTVLFNGAFDERYTIETIVETFRDISFPRARTFMLPGGVMKFMAALLRPLSATGLGVHPERIEKLMLSTNIVPLWANENGLPTRERLRPGLETWKNETDGAFS